MLQTLKLNMKIGKQSLVGLTQVVMEKDYKMREFNIIKVLDDVSTQFSPNFLCFCCCVTHERSFLTIVLSWKLSFLRTISLLNA
jgi:hypothetical protein